MEVSVCSLAHGRVWPVLSMAGDDLGYVRKSLFSVPEPLTVAQDVLHNCFAPISLESAPSAILHHQGQSS